MDIGKPYTDLEITEEYVIREFDENVDPIELLWHRDDEHRTLYLQGETDWMIQLEDELPTIFIPPIFIVVFDDVVTLFPFTYIFQLVPLNVVVIKYH